MFYKICLQIAAVSGYNEWEKGQTGRKSDEYSRSGSGAARLFRPWRTKNLAFRAVALERLEREIRAREHRLLRALRQDLGKSNMEAYMTEIGLTCSELRYIAAHIHRWAAKKWVPTPLSQFPSRSFCQAEPYGVVLVMAPWNYPFLLSMEPLIGALAAGNTVVLKPSAYAPHMAKELEELLGLAFRRNM